MKIIPYDIFCYNNTTYVCDVSTFLPQENHLAQDNAFCFANYGRDAATRDPFQVFWLKCYETIVKAPAKEDDI